MHHVEAMEQIFAEIPLANGVHDVTIGRGDEPDVDAQFLRAADARERPIFEEAQELGLERTAHIRDFIQKNRAAISFFDQPGFLS